jgi:hypothetical protein
VDTVVEYEGPTTPAGTHRYIFLVYEQVRAAAENISAVDLTLPEQKSVCCGCSAACRGSAAKGLMLLCVFGTIIYSTMCSFHSSCRYLALQFLSALSLEPVMLLLQDGYVKDPAPVADRSNFDYTAYADNNALIGPVSAIYYTAAAGK